MAAFDLSLVDNDEFSAAHVDSIEAAINRAGYSPVSNYFPSLTQGAAVSKTTNRARYHRSGEQITGDVIMTVTAPGGTAANNVLVSIPSAAASTNTNSILGGGYLYDSSVGNYYPFLLMYYSSTVCSLLFQNGIRATAEYLGTSQFTAALSLADIITYTFDYESAS